MLWRQPVFPKGNSAQPLRTPREVVNWAPKIIENILKKQREVHNEDIIKECVSKLMRLLETRIRLER